MRLKIDWIQYSLKYETRTEVIRGEIIWLRRNETIERMEMKLYLGNVIIGVFKDLKNLPLLQETSKEKI